MIPTRRLSIILPLLTSLTSISAIPHLDSNKLEPRQNANILAASSPSSDIKLVQHVAISIDSNGNSATLFDTTTPTPISSTSSARATSTSSSTSSPQSSSNSSTTSKSYSESGMIKPTPGGIAVDEVHYSGGSSTSNSSQDDDSSSTIFSTSSSSSTLSEASPTSLAAIQTTANLPDNQNEAIITSNIADDGQSASSSSTTRSDAVSTYNAISAPAEPTFSSHSKSVTNSHSSDTSLTSSAGIDFSSSSATTQTITSKDALIQTSITAKPSSLSLSATAHSSLTPNPSNPNNPFGVGKPPAGNSNCTLGEWQCRENSMYMCEYVIMTPEPALGWVHTNDCPTECSQERGLCV
ncbi:uncharacterized protein L201_003882 [Kwoniella dendrophila CBS 6074]|uniref:CBM1 domain-containing protein n=1 Tax=Kwoniella dendrophila CBS 6074 TaxID=1295534 RepID=A0AAX4JUB7_9TREE